MKEQLTSINILVDESGSMGNLLKDTIGGINHFVSEQKLIEGEAFVTLVTFNTKHKTVYDFVNLKDIGDITTKEYNPGGGTALLDAMGTTINNVSNKLKDLKEDEMPSKVLFFVITDGQENASKEFTKAKIKSMVEEKTGWDFVFMGANVDSFDEAGQLGIATSRNYVASSVGTKDLYRDISRNMTRYRTSTKSDFDKKV